ncbi:MAG TPA: DNA primase, partial [Bacteroidales bacterium]|nr:DNA primase [Bacteroidales bacterium]
MMNIEHRPSNIAHRTSRCYLCREMIRQETIDAIMGAVRIEEVVGDFVTLRRRGVNLVGLCPFHNEKTPSFNVNPARGIYKCFGCGKAGNAVGFVMEHEHLSYPEALRYLGRKYNVAVEEEVQTDEERQLRDRRDSLLHVHAFALDFFRKSLFETEEGKAIGLSYLKDREYREDILQKFELGYSPEAWDALTARAMNEGFSSDYLVESGLTIRKDERYYDRFRGRVIFPIHNLTGAPVAFAGRILSSDRSRPKYINSPETEIYHKSKVLYGLHHARQAIVSHDECLLVEGYTDVLSLHQAGIENVVASSGTALTVDQIRLIRRYTENITILYDGDEAGLKASFRGIDLILEQGLNVRLVLFPEGEDPDSFVRKNRVNVVRDFIRSRSENFIPFKARLLIRESEGDPVKKAGGIRDIVASVALVPDGIKRNLFIRECSQLMDIPEQTLMFEMNKMLRRRLQERRTEGGEDQVTEAPPPPPQALQTRTRDHQAVENDLVRILLNHGMLDFDMPIQDQGSTELVPVNTATYILHHLLSDGLEASDPACRTVIQVFRRHLEKEELPPIDLFLNHPDAGVARLAIDLITSPHNLSANWKRHRIHVPTEEQVIRELVINAVNAFKLAHVERELERLGTDLKGPLEAVHQLALMARQNELLR